MKQISEKIVAGLPVPDAGNKVHFFSGATLQGKKAPAGFGVRVTTGGTKSFVLFRRAAGRKYLETLGRWDGNTQGGTLTVRSAIIAADKLAKDFKNGRREDPRPERTRRLQDGDGTKGQTVSGLLDRFVARHVKGLRTAAMIEQTLDRLVKPRIGKVGIYDLKRSRVKAMLDEIADAHGATMANRTLAYIRKGFSWYEIHGHDDDFKSPIVRGMATAERSRDRVLDDDEIRDLWTALDTMHDAACFPAFVKTMLLTATRRNEVAEMSADEINGDIWTIPATRYKSLPGKEHDHVVPLSADALALLPETKAGFIFSTTHGKRSFSGFSKSKLALDAATAEIRKASGREPMPAWTFHDLRRTARTLMSRAGVNEQHAERALGHRIAGVAGVYDRHDYLPEKRAAFEALAALVSRILNPTANVEELAARRSMKS